MDQKLFSGQLIFDDFVGKISTFIPAHPSKTLPTVLSMSLVPP